MIQNKAFALYRLPHCSEIQLVTQAEGAPLCLDHITKLNGREGFVVAPFTPSHQEPVVLIQGTHTIYQPGITTLPACHTGPHHRHAAEGHAPYATDFRQFHRALCDGRFGKLVLARQKTIQGGDITQAEAYFQEACRRYPHMMVALVSAPACGTWLMATPEILLQGSGDHWHTMALAGTMPMTAQTGTLPRPLPWSAKNQEEQRLVADFLEQRISCFSTDIRRGPVHTEQAGHLAHLRTDFCFILPRPAELGTLLQSLHPTPAVCGLPQTEAHHFICTEESAPRHYYSGFAGPMYPEAETHLYVALRCMQMRPGYCILHAGGGLLPESVLENEWHETEQKMETMKLCIAASLT